MKTSDAAGPLKAEEVEVERAGDLEPARRIVEDDFCAPLEREEKEKCAAYYDEWLSDEEVRKKAASQK